MAANDNDQSYMALALQLAERGRYTTRPNPCVGCVIVKDSVVLAQGWHYRAGEGHAEVQALAQINAEQARGATAYVTLEPCAHEGKTGACATALVVAGVVRVVYAMEDPNPLVAGRGIAHLRAANVVVDGPILESQAQAHNKGFVSRMVRQRPWLTAKIASSLDGRTAMASGDSQWITGNAARADVQRLRAQSCAVMTGVDSVLHDNSRLSLRKNELLLDNVDDVIAVPPLRVVLDTHLRIDPDAAIFQSDGRVIIFTQVQSSAEKRAILQARWPDNLVIESLGNASDGAENESASLNLSVVLACLAEKYQCNYVLLETGATLLGACIEQGWVDELIVYQAPVLLGSHARPMAVLPLETMAEKIALVITDQRCIGDDLRITATIARTQ